MPQGKGTYGTRRGRPKKKKVVEATVASRINNLLSKLFEGQFRRGMSPEEGKKRGEESKEGTASEGERREAFKTPPGKRTRAQQRTQQGSRRRYQRTGKTPFNTGRAMSQEERIKKAGLGDAPHRSKK